MEQEVNAIDLLSFTAKRIELNIDTQPGLPLTPTVNGVPLTRGVWDSVIIKYAAGTFPSGGATPATTPITFTSTIPAVAPSWVALGNAGTEVRFFERGLYILNLNFHVTVGVGPNVDVMLHTRMSNGAAPYQSHSEIVPGGMTLVNQASQSTYFINYPGDPAPYYYTQIFTKAENYPSLAGAAPTYSNAGELQIFHMLPE